MLEMPIRIIGGFSGQKIGQSGQKQINLSIFATTTHHHKKYVVGHEKTWPDYTQKISLDTKKLRQHPEKSGQISYQIKILTQSSKMWQPTKNTPEVSKNLAKPGKLLRFLKISGRPRKIWSDS